MKCYFVSHQCRPFHRRFPVELAWPPAKEIPNRFWLPLPLLKHRNDARTHPMELHEKKKNKERMESLFTKIKLSLLSLTMNECTRDMCMCLKEKKVKAKRKQSMPGLLQSMSIFFFFIHQKGKEEAILVVNFISFLFRPLPPSVASHWNLATIVLLLLLLQPRLVAKQCHQNPFCLNDFKTTAVMLYLLEVLDCHTRLKS